MSYTSEVWHNFHLNVDYHFQVPFVQLLGVHSRLEDDPICASASAGCANCSNTPTLPKQPNRYGSAGHGRSPKTWKCQWRFETKPKKKSKNVGKCGQYKCFKWETVFLPNFIYVPTDFHCPSKKVLFWDFPGSTHFIPKKSRVRVSLFQALRLFDATETRYFFFVWTWHLAYPKIDGEFNSKYLRQTMSGSN